MSQDNSTTPNTKVTQLGGPPDKFISVYIVSKLKHAQTLYDLFQKYPRIRLTASWVYREVGKAHFPDQGNRPAKQWLRDNKDDILRSDAVLVWAEPLDELKNAIYEAGWAVAHGRPVYVIGTNRSYSTWQMDQGITRIGSLEQALDYLTSLTMYPKEKPADAS